MKALYITKIFLKSEKDRIDPNEKQIVQGVWIQTIGQFVEAVGVTEEALSSEEHNPVGRVNNGKYWGLATGSWYNL